MKDSESGEKDCFVTPRVKPKKALLSGNVFVGSAIALGLVVLVLGIGLIASHCEHSLLAVAEILQAEQIVSEAAHELVIRGEGSESKGIVFRSVADAIAVRVAGSSGLGTVTVTATAFKTVGTVGGTAPAVTMQSGTAYQTPWMPSVQSTTSFDAAPVGVSVPISTRTELSTIYSIRSTVHLTKTRTATTTVTLPVSSAADADICSVEAATKTVSVYVTLSPLPDKTVTGDAPTATQVNTDLSLTNGLPDVTLPGKPSTHTAVQTDISLTKGLPDATVSGNPETLTNVRTDVSVTTGLPDATVSGNPGTVTDVETSAIVTSKMSTAAETVVITDLWDSVRSSRRAPTATEDSAVVTVTVPGLSVGPAKSSGSSSALADAATGPSSDTGDLGTDTVTVTQTGGPPTTSMITVHITLGMNTTAASHYPSGSVVATAPIEVSQGSKRPQPRGWGGGGSVNFACTIMLFATMMFAL